MRRYVRFTLPAGELALLMGTLAWAGTGARWLWCVGVAALMLAGVGVVVLSIAWAIGDFE